MTGRGVACSAAQKIWPGGTESFQNVGGEGIYNVLTKSRGVKSSPRGGARVYLGGARVYLGGGKISPRGGQEFT